MHIIQKIGLGTFILALALFTLSLGLEKYQLTEESLQVSRPYHKEEIMAKAQENGLIGNAYGSNFGFIKDLKKTIKDAQASLEEKAKEGIPEGVSEWDYKLGDWNIKDYIPATVKKSSVGTVSRNPGLWFFLTFGLGIIGGLLYILPKFIPLPGIKNNHIYHRSMTRGLQVNIRTLFLGLTLAGVLIYGIFYMNSKLLWRSHRFDRPTDQLPGLFREGSKDNTPQRSASPDVTGWLGMLTGIYLIGFYILLYWSPQYITSWILIVDPLSLTLSGNEASQWFLYGTLYTVIVLVMGVRMMSKYRHNRYQLIRTGSVMFSKRPLPSCCRRSWCD